MTAELKHCDRCGAPLEPPIVYADGLCGPYLDIIGSACGHVPICQECARVHTAEVIADIRYARTQLGEAKVPVTAIEQRAGRLP